MTLATGPVAVAALLLVVAAAAKVAKPGGTTRALRAAGFRVRDAPVRIGAAAEAAIGIASLVLPGPVPPALLAASYLMFACFVALALLKKTPIRTCGCFGETDSPPTIVHIAVDLFFSATSAYGAAASAMAASRQGLAVEVVHQVWDGLPFAMFVVVTGFLAYLVMVELPRLKAEL